MVASLRPLNLMSLKTVVSIPFIAGQWSLRYALASVNRRLATVSIPFIAGQWSLQKRATRTRRAPACLNPLHCGAVVASRHAASRMPRTWMVSIPFIAGQWSLPRNRAGGGAMKRKVSIPFIAGQWSLPPCSPYGGRGRRRSQSPSLRGSGRFHPGPRLVDLG